MMLEMEVMHPGQQDMDLIDILWKQDIDLGARREVFDYNHRQKEHELQRQRQLEEEKREHLLREQEKALLAQLQLDEETGEYIPRPLPPPPPTATATATAAAAPLEVTQNVGFTQESDEAMSFDDCLLLLAETFPVDAAENTSVCLDTPATAAAASIMMSPEPPALSPAAFPPGQRMSPDLEQAWMELWSLPELQQSLTMQMEDTLDTAACPLPNSPDVQSPNFPFYPVNNLADGKPNCLSVGPAEFAGAFDGSAPSMAPAAEELVQMEAKAPPLTSDFSAAGGFCDVFYSSAVVEEGGGRQEFEGNESAAMADVPNKAPFTPMDIYSLSPGDALDRGKQSLTEVPDSDSGISSNASPTASSPQKSAYGGGSFSYSDSDMDEFDQNPGSAESDYSEMFSINFQPDGLEAAISLCGAGGQPLQEKNPKQPAADPAEEGGHKEAPFTKDKQRRRSDVRLSRDEQRAKALKIPFTVDMIINLPVDDFNEMMSKQQLTEAQLALVRDIRRRGKNKVAAQNCRKRKMENIVGLENDLDSLKEEKEQLLSEKGRYAADLKEMKRQLNSLYLQVFGLLRDEHGNAYSPSEYSLQQSTNGSIFLVPRVKKTFRSEDER